MAALRKLNKTHERIINWSTEEEYGRLERRHTIIKTLLDNKLHEAPIEEPRRILDCSAGSGCWALEACDRYQDCLVVALDRSGLHCVGPLSDRLQCMKGSLQEPLPFADNYFDLVHAQAVQPQVKDWSVFMSELYRVTAPGGWVYIIESDARGLRSDDDSLSQDSAVGQWCRICNEASLYMGFDTSIHLKLATIMKTAGFECIKERVMKAKSYSGNDPSTRDTIVSKSLRQDMLEGIRHFGKDALEVLSFANPDLDSGAFVGAVQRELKDPAMHWYLEYRGVCGQKPLSTCKAEL